MIGFMLKVVSSIFLLAVVVAHYREDEFDSLSWESQQQLSHALRPHSQLKTLAATEKMVRPYLIAVLSVVLAEKLQDPLCDIYSEVQNQRRRFRETEITSEEHGFRHDENMRWLGFWMLCALLCAILVAVALGLRRRHISHQERMDESKTQEDVRDKQAERFVKLMQAVQMPDTPDRVRFQHMVFQTVVSNSSTVQPRPCLPRSDPISSPCRFADDERESMSEWSQVAQV
ncbi:unnamed protein product [Symbiodinium microadriaticum]|nr:unnamed protein product [Symbiodinium microadriaticum]